MKAGRFIPLFALTLSGCAQLYDIRDTIEGYTHPLVASAMFLGVQEPDSEFIDLVDTEFETGAVVQAFLADATNVEDIENAPIAGGKVKVAIGQGDPLLLDEEEQGSYRITGGEGLYYEVGKETTMNILVDGEEGSISSRLPEAADIDLDWVQPVEELIIDLSHHNFDTVLAVVVDMESGEVMWTNEPGDIGELYELTHASEPIKRVVIPAATFNREGVLAVGVAGMMVSDMESVDGMNIALSSYMTGQMVFTPVCTYDEDYCAVVTPEDLANLP